MVADSFLFQEIKAAVVETWHIGNIAYAEIRTSSVANEYKALLRKQLLKYNPFFFFLDISEKTFRERANKPVPLGIEEDQFIFYQNIKNNILSLFNEYNIDYHSIDANQNTDKVMKDINEILSDQKTTPRDRPLNVAPFSG